MAESLVNVTEGSGKKLHTFSRSIGVNIVEDEIVALGDQYLATFTLTSQATSIATINDHVLQLMAGASLNVYVRRLYITQVALATTAGVIGIQLLRLSTAGTGGTTRTPVAMDASDSIGCTGMTLPSSKGTEVSGELWRGYCQTVQTLPASGPAKSVEMFGIDFDALRLKPIRIPAGTTNGLAVKILTAAAGATVNVVITGTEANF